MRSASDTFLLDLRIEVGLDRFQLLQHLRELRRLVDLPVLLRREPDARTVRAAALVGAAERRGRRPGCRDELRDGEARGEDLLLQRDDFRGANRLAAGLRDRVLPDQGLLRHQRAEVARDRAHVAVRELEPGARERVGELVGILQEAPRNFPVGRVEPEREVRRQHPRHVLLRLVERVRDRGFRAFRLPLLCTGGTLRQLPFESEQVLEEVVAELRRRVSPDDLGAAGDAIGADARVVLALPAEALVLERARFRLRADERRVTRAVGLAEGVAARDQRDGLLVVHRHAGEGLADVARRQLAGRDCRSAPPGSRR